MFLSGRVCARRREKEECVSLYKRVWVSERQRENTRFRLNACVSVRQWEYAFLSMFVCLSSSEECVFLSEHVCGYLQERGREYVSLSKYVFLCEREWVSV